MTRRQRWAALAWLVAAGALGCQTEEGWPIDPVGGFDASPSDAAFDLAPTDARGDVSDVSSSTLSDGRLVTGERPVFKSYARDVYYYDVATMQLVQTVTLIRGDGAIVVPGCGGVATLAELTSFVDVATDLATVDALLHAAPCLVAGSGDYVTMSYVGYAPVKQAASCDPQLKALAAAGTALVQAVCARTADAGTDGP